MWRDIWLGELHSFDGVNNTRGCLGLLCSGKPLQGYTRVELVWTRGSKQGTRQVQALLAGGPAIMADGPAITVNM